MKTGTAAISPKVKDRVSAEEWQIRVDLAAAYRLVALHGWDDMIFTHISARVPGPEHHFLINPYGLLFDEITASSLLKIDLDGNAVMESEYKPNAAGFTIHSAIHETREDAQCVMHLHTIDGTAVSAMEGGLQPLNQTAMLVCDEIAHHEYEGVALDLDERPRLVSDLGDKNLMLLWNHGTLAIGKSVAQAFLRMYFFERACSMQVRSMAAPGLHRPSEAAMATARKQGRGIAGSKLANEMAWPALLRKLDKVDGGYAA
jgi:ribulose-5-phosphate 4-epimerase/fuculose-1-phosphate aldolase